MLLKKLRENYRLLFILFLLNSCNNKLDKNLFIEQLNVPDSVYTSEDRGDTLIYKNNIFIIHGFKRNEIMKAYIDSFVEKHKKKDAAFYTQYSLSFYKFSEYTNKEYLEKNPRDLVRISQDKDLVYNYIYFNNKLSFFEYENGKIIFPKSSVTVE